MRKCGCGCGERVEPASGPRIYRSDKCRKRAQKRRYRARAKARAKARARANGTPAFVDVFESRYRKASLVRDLVATAKHAGRVEALAQRELEVLEEALLRELGLDSPQKGA